ncbi:MAG: sigma-54 dependent transcriptional regulator [Candidatus Sphingomonas phytovorans]|nr:sigma-54 dependent transcriptional regulator [Sphingomonas sp.]WEK01518.1 MAG: sigma-54 dependent transcriptional regulator [Sphingomonas sp.]
MNEGAVIRVALIEDDEDLRSSTTQLLSLAGYTVEAFAAAMPALGTIDADFAGIVITDVRMPGMSGIELFRALHERDATLPVILVTGHGDVAMAVDALKGGAWDFLPKPFDPHALVAAVDRAATARGLSLENRRLRSLAQSVEASGLIGTSPAIRRLREMIPVLADADIDLFIEGETGTGKELFAREIHRAGKRARYRFMPIACGALPDALIESDLFSTSGAGSIAAASRGTVFLDDIDKASPALQARIGALVEDRALRDPRARDAIPLDLRVIATGAEEAQRGPDAIAPALFYRLAAVRLRMPPLRERREDIPLLFAHLLDLSAARMRCPIPTLTGSARAHLLRHDWPGNVRELAHFADRLILGLDGESIGRGGTSAETRPDLPAQVNEFERQLLVDALKSTSGDAAATIIALGIPRKTFYYKIKRHGIDLDAFRKRGERKGQGTDTPSIA